MTIKWNGVPQRYQAAVALLTQAHMGKTPLDATVTVKPTETSICIARTADTGTIGYHTGHDLMRAVTLWLAHAQTEANFQYHEQAAFDECGAMLDLARNGVLTVPALKAAILRLAGLGYTQLWLYLEDVFEIPEQPYFGHLRGRYSQAALHELGVCRSVWVDADPSDPNAGASAECLEVAGF